jgi:hypothetical protein
MRHAGDLLIGWLPGLRMATLRMVTKCPTVGQEGLAVGLASELLKRTTAQLSRIKVAPHPDDLNEPAYCDGNILLGCYLASTERPTPHTNRSLRRWAACRDSCDSHTRVGFR